MLDALIERFDSIINHVRVEDVYERFSWPVRRQFGIWVCLMLYNVVNEPTIPDKLSRPRPYCGSTYLN